MPDWAFQGFVTKNTVKLQQQRLISCPQWNKVKEVWNETKAMPKTKKEKKGGSTSLVKWWSILLFVN